MDLKEIGINTRKSVHWAQVRDYLGSPCECGIEALGSISHGVCGPIQALSRLFYFIVGAIVGKGSCHLRGWRKVGDSGTRKTSHAY